MHASTPSHSKQTVKQTTQPQKQLSLRCKFLADRVCACLLRNIIQDWNLEGQCKNSYHSHCKGTISVTIIFNLRLLNCLQKIIYYVPYTKQKIRTKILNKLQKCREIILEQNVLLTIFIFDFTFI